MNYLIFFILIILFSIVATTVFCCMRRKIKKEYMITFPFFSLIAYFGVSFIKMVLGEPNFNIFESFADAGWFTLVHYAIPLLIGAIIIPLLTTVIKTDTIILNLIESSISFCFMILCIFLLIFNEITNVQAVWLLLISEIIAIAFIYIKNKKDNTGYGMNLKMQPSKNKFLAAMPFVSFWLISIYLFYPGELYLNNIEEMRVDYSAFLMVTLIYILIIGAALIFICSFLLIDANFYIFLQLIFSTALAGYIQSLFLNGELGQMDGLMVKWPPLKVCINLVIWILIFTIIGFAAGKWKEKAWKVFRYVSIYVCLIQVATLGFLIISNGAFERNKAVLSTEGEFELSKNDNIIVFALDWYDSQIIEQIYKDDPEFFETLNDFIYYNNATSQYSHTDYAIPYLLTGIERAGSKNRVEYWKNAYTSEQGYLISDISDAGYDVRVYTDGRYFAPCVKDVISNYLLGAKIEYSYGKIISQIDKMARYKAFPFLIKNNFWYSSEEMDNMAASDKIYSPNNDLIFYNDLMNNSISIAANENHVGVYRFYHLFGAHAPYIMTEQFGTKEDFKDEASKRERMLSQAKGSFLVVLEFIRQMKEAGVYDNSIIIITADHGQNYIYHKGQIAEAQELGLKKTSSPIVFIKYPNYSGNGLEVSEAPITQSDVLATIAKIAGVKDWNKYGTSVNDIKPEMDRERIYTYSISDEISQEYLIKGKVSDEKAWRIINRE